MAHQRGYQLNPGDEIEVIGDLVLDKRIEPGMRGRIIDKSESGLFRVRLSDGSLRYLAGSEMRGLTRFEIIRRIIADLEEIPIPKHITDKLEAWLDGEVKAGRA